jgi:ribosomal protein L37E
MSDNLENLLAKTLAESCRAYIRHGAEHLFAKAPTQDDLLQAILNMQGSMEVMAKLYQLKTNGWKSILEKKHHSEPEAELIIKLNSGKLRTTGYEVSKKHLIKRRELEELDEELLAKLQGYRNAIAHLGLPALPAGIKDEIKQLMVRVLNALAWEALAGRWTEIFLENRSSIVLGPELFAKVMADKSYVNEAIKLSDEKSSRVRNCPECWKPTFGEVEIRDTAVLCFCCGYGLAEMMVKFAQCPICEGENNLFYDASNAGNMNLVGAICLDCRQKMDVVVCQECGSVALNASGSNCKSCGFVPTVTGRI